MVDRAIQLRDQEIKRLRKIIKRQNGEIVSLAQALSRRLIETARLNEIDGLFQTLDPNDSAGAQLLTARREDLKLQDGLNRCAGGSLS